MELVNALTGALWYIVGNHDTLAERACPVPAPLAHFKNYYCPEKRQIKKIDCSVLSEESLQNHSTTILMLTEKSFFFKENSGQLLNSYVTLCTLYSLHL